MMPDHSVLIVDDDPGALEAFEPMLTARGYAVRVALDADQALRAIQESVPSAVILDLHLPIVSGAEFLRGLRSNHAYAHIPVAVVTGDYLLDERVTTELDALSAQLFFKPLWEEDLVKLVDGLISGEVRAARLDR